MHLSVDFSALHAAVARMGAAGFDPGSLIHRQAEPLDPIDVGLKGGLEIAIREIDSENGLLSYKGRQVLLYIQDHGHSAQAALEDGSTGRKFHVADCTALKSMRKKNRFERYVVTNDLSGEFYISGRDYRSGSLVEGRTRLKVCKYCLGELNYQGYKTGNRGAVFKRFRLERFFSTYSSFFPHLPKRLAGTPDSDYTADWPAIAGAYKADQGFRCEKCGVDLSEHRELLHGHHRDGVKTNNSRSNIRALCAHCHRHQPSHEHMFVPHSDTQLINRLRREQKLLGSSNWDQVFELADPAVHGVVHQARKNNMPVPEVGYEIQAADGRVIVELELAWPRRREGVAIVVEDIPVAAERGWNVKSVPEMLTL